MDFFLKIFTLEIKTSDLQEQCYLEVLVCKIFVFIKRNKTRCYNKQPQLFQLTITMFISIFRVVTWLPSRDDSRIWFHSVMWLPYTEFFTVSHTGRKEGVKDLKSKTQEKLIHQPKLLIYFYWFCVIYAFFGLGRNIEFESIEVVVVLFYILFLTSFCKKVY